LSGAPQQPGHALGAADLQHALHRQGVDAEVARRVPAFEPRDRQLHLHVARVGDELVPRVDGNARAVAPVHTA
jgi:hypothetical protein